MTVDCEALEPGRPASVATSPVLPPVAAPPSMTARRWWRWGVLSVAVVGLAVVLVRAPGAVTAAAQAIRRLHRLDWQWLAVAGAVEVASMASFAELQRGLLRVGGVRTRTRSVFAVTMAGNAVAQTLLGPGSVVAAGYTVGQFRRRGADTPLALWVVAVAGMVASVALLGEALLGVGLTHTLQPGLLWAAVAILVVGVPAFWVLVTQPAALHAVLTTAQRIQHRGRPRRGPGQWAEAAADRLARLRPAPLQWLRAAGFGTTTWLFDFGCLTAAFAAVAGTGALPWRALVLAYLAGQVGLLLRLTPGGLGLAESGLVGVLTAYHVPVGTAVAATALYRLLSLWGVVGLGWLCYGFLARVSRT